MSFPFHITVQDPHANDPGSLSQFADVLTSALTAALNEYGRYISGTVPIDVEIFLDSDLNSTLEASSRNDDFSQLPMVKARFVLPTKIAGGVDLNDTSPDLFLDVGSDLFTSGKYWLDTTNPAPPDKIDVTSRIIGELRHAFGVFTNVNPDTGAEPVNQDDPMAHLIQKIGSQWFFVGATAKQVFGGPVPIGKTVPVGDGKTTALDLTGILPDDPSDVFGVAETIRPVTAGAPADTTPPGQRFHLSPLDLAILKDLNPTLNVVIPDHGGVGNDTFHAVAGTANFYDGMGGRNTVVEAHARADITTTVAPNGTINVASGGVVDTLTDVARVRLADGVLIFDAGPNALPAYRLYQAAFARVPDEAGLLVQSHLAFDPLVQQKIAAGASATAKHGTFSVSEAQYQAEVDVAARFIGAREFIDKYGANVTDGQFVDLLYQNVLGRLPDDAGRAVQLGALQHGTPRAELLANFAESAENVALTAANTAGGLWSVFPDPAFA